MVSDGTPGGAFRSMSRYPVQAWLTSQRAPNVGSTIQPASLSDRSCHCQGASGKLERNLNRVKQDGVRIRLVRGCLGCPAAPVTVPRAGDQLSGPADRDPAQGSSWQRVHRTSHPGGSTPPRPRGHTEDRGKQIPIENLPNIWAGHFSEGHQGEIGLQAQVDLPHGRVAALRDKAVLDEHLHVSEVALQRAPLVDPRGARGAPHEFHSRH